MIGSLDLRDADDNVSYVHTQKQKAPAKKRPQIDKRVVNKMRAMYIFGISISSIAKRFQVTNSTVRKHLTDLGTENLQLIYTEEFCKESGQTFTGSILSQEEIKEMKALQLEGLSEQSLAIVFGVSLDIVRSSLK
jgi:DNA-binding transcriptional regulator YiaG